MNEILELSTIIPERPKANLKTPENPEGKSYELAVPEEFGAVALQEYGRLVNEMDDLWERKLTAPQKVRLEKVLNALAVMLIPDAPLADLERLPAVTKRSLAIRFFVQAGQLIAEGLDVESPSVSS